MPWLLSIIFLLAPNLYAAGAEIPGACILGLTRSGEYLAGSFNLTSEFPRLLLPAAWRQREPSAVPRSVLDQQAALLARAVGSRLRRLTVLVSEQDAAGASLAPRPVAYFPYLIEKVGSPDIEILASSGLVRATISGIYDELLSLHAANSNADLNGALESMAADTRDLNPLDIRSLGGDLDVLLRLSDHVPEADRATLLESAKTRITAITNSVENRYESRDAAANSAGAVHRTLFTVGDVKEFRAQLGEAVSSGGSTTDHLAFSFRHNAFVEPPRDMRRVASIVDDLLLGYYEYLPPAPGARTRSPQKQTVRGARPLLELPWLRLKDDRVLRLELEVLLRTVQTEEGRRDFDPKAREQFHKMVRNQRRGGAHNRFYRSPKDSVEGLFLAIADQLKSAPNSPLIPEFADEFPRTGPEAPHKLPVPTEVLMPFDRFIAEHTENGYLFHGTPEIENSLAILRGGFFLSHDKQGGAYFGRGVYTSKLQSAAQVYAGARGMVFRLPVRRDANLRVLEYSAYEGSDFQKRVEREAAAEGQDPFELLTRRYGIDVIVRHHVLVQNSWTLVPPQSIRDILLAFMGTVDSGAYPIPTRVTSFVALSRYAPLLRLAYPDLAEELDGVEERFARFITSFAVGDAKELEVFNGLQADEHDDVGYPIHIRRLLESRAGAAGRGILDRYRTERDRLRANIAAIYGRDYYNMVALDFAVARNIRGESTALLVSSLRPRLAERSSPFSAAHFAAAMTVLEISRRADFTAADAEELLRNMIQSSFTPFNAFLSSSLLRATALPESARAVLAVWPMVMEKAPPFWTTYFRDAADLLHVAIAMIAAPDGAEVPQRYQDSLMRLRDWSESRYAGLGTEMLILGYAMARDHRPEARIYAMNFLARRLTTLLGLDTGNGGQEEALGHLENLVSLLETLPEGTLGIDGGRACRGALRQARWMLEDDETLARHPAVVRALALLSRGAKSATP